jgi:hypothetical protein
VKWTALVAFVCAGFYPGAAFAQTASSLQVRLESAPGISVSGALVALVDERDSVVVEGLTNEAGTRVLRAAPGTYRIRARRIGFLPFVSASISVPHDGELLLRVESERVALQSIVVTSQSKCVPNDHNARALSLVWDEIEKALRSSQITTEDLAGVGRGELFHENLAVDGSVISADTTAFTINGGRPFAAVSAESLARTGYVVGDEHTGWVYYAPDETVLLSDQFAGSHCFRLVRDGDHPREIGVAFEPEPGRRTSDIIGILWVDEASSELREIKFTFTNAGVFSRFGASGMTHFTRLRSGAWLVDDWWLRAPLLELHQEPYMPSHFVKTGYTRDGGRILRPQPAG